MAIFVVQRLDVERAVGGQGEVRLIRGRIGLFFSKGGRAPKYEYLFESLQRAAQTRKESDIATACVENV